MNIIKENGISVGITRVDKFFFVKVKLVGTITYNDYENMVPMLKYTVQNSVNPKVKVFIDATEFNGWELRAAWDDFRYSMEFKELITKVAYVGTKTWEEYGVKIGSWFIDGDIKFFNSTEDAYDWLNKNEVEPKTAVQKDLKSRKEAIKDELQELFEANLNIVDYNVPEPDDQDAAEIIVSILEDKLNEIKASVEAEKYK